MQHFTLRKYTDNSILFEGRFGSFGECLEQAVNNKITLSHINLKNKNLCNLNLDGSEMPCANFSGSNLSGANLSEASLPGASFKNTSLYNCCMSFSNLQKSDFSGASFGATLIEGANMQSCTFSTLSCFDLDFIYCETLVGSVFIDPDNTRFKMSGVPVVIKGLLNVPIILFDDTVKIGTRAIKRNAATPRFIQILGAYSYKIAQNKTQNNAVA